MWLIRTCRVLAIEPWIVGSVWMCQAIQGSIANILQVIITQTFKKYMTHYDLQSASYWTLNSRTQYIYAIHKALIQYLLVHIWFTQLLNASYRLPLQYAVYISYNLFTIHIFSNKFEFDIWQSVGHSEPKMSCKNLRLAVIFPLVFIFWSWIMACRTFYRIYLIHYGEQNAICRTLICRTRFTQKNQMPHSTPR